MVDGGQSPRRTRSAPDRPSLGRIVHFTEHRGGPPRAAVVLDAKGMVTTLRVYNVVDPRGDLNIHEAPFSAEPKPGHWNWPPRV